MAKQSLKRMKRNGTRIDILMAVNEIKSDTALAEKLGISPQALYKKVSGNITMNTIEQLAKVFNVSIREMFKDENNV